MLAFRFRNALAGHRPTFKKFYDRFGDDIAGEFVDWFNAVDTTYQQQLRDLNDLNWERFKAELHSAIAQSEGRSAANLMHSETRLSDKIAKLQVGMEQRFSGLMKWMFIYWSGMMLSVGGILIAILKK